MFSAFDDGDFSRTRRSIFVIGALSFAIYFYELRFDLSGFAFLSTSPNAIISPQHSIYVLFAMSLYLVARFLIGTLVRWRGYRDSVGQRLAQGQKVMESSQALQNRLQTLLDTRAEFEEIGKSIESSLSEIKSALAPVFDCFRATNNLSVTNETVDHWISQKNWLETGFKDLKENADILFWHTKSVEKLISKALRVVEHDTIPYRNYIQAQRDKSGGAMGPNPIDQEIEELRKEMEISFPNNLIKDISRLDDLRKIKPPAGGDFDLLKSEVEKAWAMIGGLQGSLERINGFLHSASEIEKDWSESGLASRFKEDLKLAGNEARNISMIEADQAFAYLVPVAGFILSCWSLWGVTF